MDEKTQEKKGKVKTCPETRGDGFRDRPEERGGIKIDNKYSGVLKKGGAGVGNKNTLEVVS